MPMDSTARLYASAIAVVSGVYALASWWLAVAAEPMLGDALAALGIAGWLMVAVGIVVLAHGVALITPAASRIGRASGPLMVLWAAIMLAGQVLLATSPGGAPMMGSRMTAGIGWDAGMAAIAVLMLISGVIMSTRGDSMA